MGEEFHCIGDPGASGAGHVTSKIPVVMWTLMDEESFCASVGPGSSFHGSIMD